MDTQIEQHIEIDTERQHKAKEYARTRRRLSLVNMAIGIAGVIILLATNLNSWLRNLLQPLGWHPIAGWFPWQVLVYFLILVLGYEVLTAPLAYYNAWCWRDWQLSWSMHC
jgi:hypothetical protein